MLKIKHKTSGEVLVTVEGGPLKNADLQGAFLHEADLTGTYLGSANLRGADLSGADLDSANLQSADLRLANLKGACLRKANLRWIQLEDAELKHADLSDADLRYSNLRGADMREADLRGANLDYGSFPLWCGSTQMKVDDRLIMQLIYHLTHQDTEHCSKRALEAIAKLEPYKDDFFEKWRPPYPFRSDRPTTKKD
jgi:hypothetical protein